MKHARSTVVAALAVGIGVGFVALSARSDDLELAGLVDAADVGPGDREDPTLAAAEATRRSLASRAGLRVEDLLVVPSYPEG